MENIKFKRIFVDGYKNLIECEANLTDFNILVGANNSGKSNFFELFSFIKGVIFGNNELKKNIFTKGVSPSGFSSVCNLRNHKNKPINISLTFENNSSNGIIELIEYSFSIQCIPILHDENFENTDTGFIEEQLIFKNINTTGKPITLFKREKNYLGIRTNQGTLKKYKIQSMISSLEIIPMLNPDFEKLSPNFESTFSSVVKSIKNIIVVASYPDSLRRDMRKGRSIHYEKFNKISSFDILSEIAKLEKHGNLFELFKSALCQVLDLEDVIFNSVEADKNIKKESTEAPSIYHFLFLKLPGQPLSDVSNFSDGTFKIIAILIILFSPQIDVSLLCIEELENCLHPKALKTLISLFQQISYEKNILLSTHSPYILNNVNPKDVIIARIHEDGDTGFEQINNIKELQKRLSKGYINFGDLLYKEFQEEETF